MKRWLWTGLFIIGLVWAVMSFPGLAGRGDYTSLVLDFREDISMDQIEADVQTIAQTYHQTPRLNSKFSDSDRIYVVEGDQTLLKQLRRSPLAQHVEAIAPNYRYKTLETVNDPDYVKQWNLRSIGIESAWNETHGEGVTVAVIDTGISIVPDLAETEFVEGYDFVNDRPDAADDNGHGTHVAGTIAQSTNNGYGVAGIAYKAKLMPLKVLDASGAGEISDIAEAIRFAADHGADVINMSLGGGGDTLLLREAIAYADRKGVVIVAAAGNENMNAASFPARYPQVIAVAALDASGQRAPYSNYGAGVDIAAPGGAIAQGNVQGGILQNTIDPATGESVFLAFQGTSMAAPHVAGVAALIRSVGVDDPAAIAQILQESARSVEEDPLNHYGAGLLDAATAVKQAADGQLNLRHFWRWLQDNGYLNLKFWFDGGVVALLPKIGMVLASYLLAWLIRRYIPAMFGGAFFGGIVFGSAGLFFLRGLYIFDLPQWPMRLMGSSLPELGTAIQAESALNPIFASVLIPFLLVALLLGHPTLKWFAIATCLGVAACLGISAFTDPALVWLGSGLGAQIFLIVNALLCFGLGYLAAKAEAERA
jgi:serine protease